MKILERLFKLRENNTTARAEVRGGVTTFMTMAYIMVVNPSIMASTGMDADALFTSTVISAAFACIMMGLIANLPLALASGMGINAFFAYTVVLQMGYSWEMALAAVFIEGIVFIILSALNIRSALERSIPAPLKHAIAVGIGLFIAMNGLVNVGAIVQGGAFSTMGDVLKPEVILTLLGVCLIAVLMVKKIYGAMLISMAVITVISIIIGSVVIPEGFSPISLPHSIEPILFKMDFSQIFTYDMIVVILTFIFTDIFDTAGTFIAICDKMNIKEKDNTPKNMKRAFLADAVSTTVGATIGISPVTSYMESTAGIAAGGRTGMTSVVTGLMFILALFFSPIFGLVPIAASSATLIVVGIFMITAIKNIDFNNFSIAIPTFITIIIIPLSYSIADGIMYGFLSYVVIHLLLGYYRNISPMMYLLSIFFIAKIIFL